MSLIDLTVRDFLKELASSSPAPGGGSVAALAGALGAGLVSMVGRLTVGKKGYEDAGELFGGIITEADKMRGIFESLVDEDTSAFNMVMDAYRLAKGTDEEKNLRKAAIQNALKEAVKVPLRTAGECVGLSEMAETAVSKGNKNALSDAGTSALLSLLAMKVAVYNVKINLGGVEEVEFVEDINNRLGEIIESVEKRVRNTESIISERL